MPESGAPIYQLESKLVLRYFRKHRVGRLGEHLLAETLEAFNVPMAPSMLVFGAVAKLLSAPARDGAVSTPVPFQDEVCQHLIRRGFLLQIGAVLPSLEVGGYSLSSVQSVLGCPPLLSFSEVGESSRGAGFEEIGGPPGEAIDLSLCFQTLGVSHEGNVKGFLDFMTQVDAEQRQEAPVSTSKFKKSRGVNNLECTINYDAGVLVLAGARQEGPCCHVISSGFCGVGYVGFFFFFSPVLMSFLYASCMLRDAFMLFINFFAYL
jgi:hypothetical protein